MPAQRVETAAFKMTSIQRGWIVAGTFASLAQLACPPVYVTGRTIDGAYETVVIYEPPGAARGKIQWTGERNLFVEQREIAAERLGMGLIATVWLTGFLVVVGRRTRQA